MSDVLEPKASGTDALIGQLAAGLRPTKRLPPPWLRAALWLSAAVWFGVLLSMFADMSGLWTRLFAVPDMWLSQAGALLTAVLAAWSAFQTSVPGRSAAWSLLPIPALVLWVGASTAGCLRQWAPAATEAEPPMHPMACMVFLLLVSVPLGMLLTFLLMRACPLRPRLTALLAGLASAGASATLLALIHPFDATVDDLSIHLVAVLVVIAGAEIAGVRYFRSGSD